MRQPLPDIEFRAGDEPLYRYWADVPRPPGATTQHLSFRIRLHDFVAHTPASHFAIVLRARLGFDAQGTPCWISGRGMTLGDTSQAHAPASNEHAAAGGYGGARGAQAESFWPGGNFLFADTALLPGGLEDGRWYGIGLQVDEARRITVEVTPDGDTTHRASVLDRPAHPVIPDACGVLVGIGRGPSETGHWSAELRDVATGWS